MVTDLLRQTAGILSDLVEESQGHQVELEETEQEREGNKGPSGPHSITPIEVLKTEKTEESESEYTTKSSPKEKGEEAAEEKTEDKDIKEPRGKSVKPPEPDTPPPGWFESRGTGAKPCGSGGRIAKVKADSHRANKPLGVEAGFQGFYKRSVEVQGVSTGQLPGSSEGIPASRKAKKGKRRQLGRGRPWSYPGA